MRRRFFCGAAALWIGSTAANAACPANTVCAADPQTVVAALAAAGFKAKLDKDSTGDPTIASAASGYDFDIYFYGCKAGKDCTSLQFRAGWKAADVHTPDYANKWNAVKRFAQMSVKEDKTMSLSYDVTTEGGINPANFADVVDWWQVMLGEASKFFAENG
ncbi:YbjN domain-containing protein [Sphingomonas gilva]|uniref:YbjN domain-containing protein n=1 Tax=Sphingomonas gilva TaxID=2305907 RepID=A0A396RSD6_9SPHN|nr:YbjN domain-containing protein [Sphingomonas gilva]RHW17233.1 YbjN domain-containing protein [Sphingomonas gilva]